MTVEIVHANIINIINPTVITDNGLIVAICTHPTIAQRLAQLWDRYGATDVPDNTAGLQDEPDVTPISPVDNYPTHPQKES